MTEDNEMRPADPFRPGPPPPSPAPSPHVAPGSAPVSRPYSPADADPAAGPRRKPAPPPTETKDGFREIAETIVFVVVLVLLLKTFLAEAFVIPTGSMATTLLGYQYDVTCDRCGYRFPINASQEVDPEEGIPEIIRGGICPNCRHYQAIRPDGDGP